MSDFAVAYFRTFVLPAKLGGKVAIFTPTGSIGNHLLERYPSLRAPLRERLRHIVFGCGAWMHAVLATAIATGVALCVARAARGHLFLMEGTRDWAVIGRELLRTVAWPSHPWFAALAAFLVPVQYAVSPPTVVERERLLGRRGKSGVRYPLAEYKERIARSWWRVGYVELYTAYLVYVVVVFCASLYME